MKDKELRKLIGSRAKQRRLELGVNQPYIAEKMGVTASTMPSTYALLFVRFLVIVASRISFVDFISSCFPCNGQAYI